MAISLFIASRRSLFSNREGKSPALRSAVAAVSLSVAVMIASVCIVLGFKQEIRDKIVGFNSHITLSAVPPENPETEQTGLRLDKNLAGILDNAPYVKSYSLDISIPAVLKTDSDFKGIYLKGISGNGNGALALKNLENGGNAGWNDSGEGIIISRIASDELGIEAGDSVNLYSISDQIKVRRLKVEGVYNTHFDNYDDIFAYAPLGFVQELSGKMPDEGTSVQIITSDFDSIPAYTSRLADGISASISEGKIDQNLRIDNALEQGAPYFAWLGLLDTDVIVILTLMAAVAAVTMISGLLIVITDNTPLIATLKALGASNGAVRRIFILLAMKIALLGLLLGNGIMLLLMWLQKEFRIVGLEPDTYYIDFVPVEFNWWWIAAVNIAMILIVYLSLILPSARITRISPAAVLHTE